MTPPVAKEAVIRYFKQDRFAEFIGIELLDVAEGWSRARLKIKKHHLNAVDYVHGGVLFSLADLAFAAAVNSRGLLAVAINNSISYVKSVEGDVIFAEAREISSNQRIASYTVDITDATGQVVSIFQGMAYRKRAKIDFTKKD